MSLLPFTWRTLLHLAAVTLLPVAPLMLTMFSLKELFERLLKMF